MTRPGIPYGPTPRIFGRSSRFGGFGFASRLALANTDALHSSFSLMTASLVRCHPRAKPAI